MTGIVTLRRLRVVRKMFEGWVLETGRREIGRLAFITFPQTNHIVAPSFVTSAVGAAGK